MNGRVGQYGAWHWMEGMFYNPNTNLVSILAYAPVEDLKILLWVTVEDDCGNSAMTSVEFWIAPSLEAAGAQGRQCDDPDFSPADLGDMGAFQSDDRLTPGSLNWDTQDFPSLSQVTRHHLHTANLIGGAFRPDWTSPTEGWLDQDVPRLEWEYQFRVSITVVLPGWVMHLTDFLNKCDETSKFSANIHSFNLDHCRNRDFPWTPKMHAHLLWERQSGSNKATILPLPCHSTGSVFRCAGDLNLDVRNFLISSDTWDVSQLAAIGNQELHSLAEVEIISDSDIPFTIDAVYVMMAKRFDETPSLQPTGRHMVRNPNRPESKPSWAGGEEKFTLIDRCQVGDINWCRPDSDGNWVWDVMQDSAGFNIDGQNIAVEREFVIEIDPGRFGFDLNLVFAQIIAEKWNVGCPLIGYTCGPLRQNRYCNGHQHRTHCHEETGNCVDPEWAAAEGINVFNEWRFDNLHESCRPDSLPRDLVVRGSNQHAVTWRQVVFPDTQVEIDSGNGIYRASRENYCSVGDVWARPQGFNPAGAWMFPSGLGKKPLDWDIGVSNHSFFLASHPELGNGKTMWGKPICPSGYSAIGMAFFDMDTTPDKNSFLDLSKSEFCCIPSIETKLETLDELGHAGVWPVGPKCMSLKIDNIDGQVFQFFNFADSCQGSATVESWRYKN
jgi:hypothetical protein